MNSTRSIDYIDIGIVEDDSLSRDYLNAVVDGTPGMRCVWACATGMEALKRASQCQPDVILVDLYMPGISGLEFIQQARSLLPRATFLVITVANRPHIVFELLETGASGYLAKPCPPEALVDAIRAVHSGGAAFSPGIARMLLGVFHARGTLLSLLTCRERTVMALLANGLDTPRLATALGVTEATVRTHLRHVLEKLGVHTRAEAVAKYLNPKISTTLR